MSDLETLTDEIRELRIEQRQTHDAVIAIQTTLKVQCPNNERRIGELERKCRNGNRASPRSAWVDPKFLTVALMAIAALATALAAIYGAH